MKGLHPGIDWLIQLLFPIFLLELKLQQLFLLLLLQYNEQLQREELQKQSISEEQRERLIQENYALKQQLNNMRINKQQEDEGTIINMSRMLEQQIRTARKQAYHDAYIQDMKNRGYRIKYKHDLKYYLKLIKTLAITVLVLFLIYQIPFVKNFFIESYNENRVFQAIIDIFKNTFSAGF